MGIFSDFLATRTATEDGQLRRELQAIVDSGDADEPSGFSGRPGWSMLKVLGLTNLPVPPLVGQQLGYQPQDIDYLTKAVSPPTVRAIVNQIAAEDSAPGIEQDLLIHVDLLKTNPGEVVMTSPPLPNTAPTITYSGGNIGFSHPLPGTFVFNQVDLAADAEQSILNVRISFDGAPSELTITLSQDTNLTFTEGNIGPVPVAEFNGPVDDINAAMDGMIITSSDETTENMTVVISDLQNPDLNDTEVISVTVT